MDPIAHTLVGAALGQTALRRLAPLATATLVIGANLPDVDAVSYAVNEDLALGLRRGWTHGIVAMAAWPVALAVAMWLVARWRARRSGGAAPAGFRALWVLSMIGVLSHPALDWLNAYGIRLLMPLDGRWFYGDSLFIVDPWLWLTAGAAAALPSARGAARTVFWGAPAAGLTALVLLAGGVPRAAWVVWLVALAAIVGLRWSIRDERRLRRLATVWLALASIYICTMRVGTVRARAHAERWMAQEGLAVDRLAAMPVAVRPFVRDVVALSEDRYYFLRVNWPTGATIMSGGSTEVGGPTAITEAALRAPHVWGLRLWLRFPSYQTVRRPDGFRVYIRDVRFWRPGRDDAPNLGGAVVDLDHHLQPVADGLRPGEETLWATLPHPCLGELPAGNLDRPSTF